MRRTAGESNFARGVYCFGRITTWNVKSMQILSKGLPACIVSFRVGGGLHYPSVIQER